MNIAKDTLYLAISYLWRIVKLGFQLNAENYEKIAATLVLLSAKMNESTVPKMADLIYKCTKFCTKEDLLAMEQSILSVFGFDMSFSEITYSILFHALGEPNRERMTDAEKLLALAVTEHSIMKGGEETVALSIAYLIKPSLAREWSCENMHKIKVIANKVHTLYLSNKATKN
jgi:hypothetical protein